MISKNILLTGGSGFLGTYIKDAFLSNNYLTYNIGRKPTIEANHIICELSNSFPILPNIPFEKIIHIAGKAHVFPKTKEEEEEFYAVNAKGTENLLLGLSKLNKKPLQIVFISTVAVYGKTEGMLISEDMPLEANTPYGISKKQAEFLIIDWCKKNNVSYLILRLPLIAGENPPGNLGDMKRTIGNGKYVNISGNQSRKSVVIAKDIANLIVDISTDKTGIYNLTDGVHPSFNDIEKAIEYRLQKKIKISLPIWAIRPIAKVGDIMTNLLKKDMPISSVRLNKILSTLTFDDSKAVKFLNWRPNNSIDYIKHKL